MQETYVVLVRRWQKAGRVDPEPMSAGSCTAGSSMAGDGGGSWSCRGSHPPTRRRRRGGTATDRLTLRDALARLTPRQRAVLVLRFYEDLTESQTAAALGLSPSTVKSQTRVALQRLRELAPDAVASFEGVGS